MSDNAILNATSSYDLLPELREGSNFFDLALQKILNAGDQKADITNTNMQLGEVDSQNHNLQTFVLDPVFSQVPVNTQSIQSFPSEIFPTYYDHIDELGLSILQTRPDVVEPLIDTLPLGQYSIPLEYIDIIEEVWNVTLPLELYTFDTSELRPDLMGQVDVRGALVTNSLSPFLSDMREFLEIDYENFFMQAAVNEVGAIPSLSLFFQSNENFIPIELAELTTEYINLRIFTEDYTALKIMFISAYGTLSNSIDRYSLIRDGLTQAFLKTLSDYNISISDDLSLNLDLTINDLIVTAFENQNTLSQALDIFLSGLGFSETINSFFSALQQNALISLEALLPTEIISNASFELQEPNPPLANSKH